MATSFCKVLPEPREIIYLRMYYLYSVLLHFIQSQQNKQRCLFIFSGFPSRRSGDSEIHPVAEWLLVQRL